MPGLPGRLKVKRACWRLSSRWGRGLLEAGGAFAGVAVVQVGLSDSFQGACFLWGRADVAGDDQRLGVALAGLRGVRGPGRQLAEPVEFPGPAEPGAEVGAQGLLAAGGGGRVVPG